MLRVLGKTVFLDEPVGANAARHRLGLRHALLPHQQLERTITASARRHLEHVRLGAIRIADRPHTQALQQRSVGNVLGEVFDRDARRAFVCDSTSLLKGMSWDRVRMILGLAVAICLSPQRVGREPLSQPSYPP